MTPNEPGATLAARTHTNGGHMLDLAIMALRRLTLRCVACGAYSRGHTHCRGCADLIALLARMRTWK